MISGIRKEGWTRSCAFLHQRRSIYFDFDFLRAVAGEFCVPAIGKHQGEMQEDSPNNVHDKSGLQRARGAFRQNRLRSSDARMHETLQRATSFSNFDLMIPINVLQLSTALIDVEIKSHRLRDWRARVNNYQSPGIKAKLL